jgi:ferric-dicitrate binding protein FerR (iron transport regulator)
MRLAEARRFVAQFVEKNYDPKEYTAFLQWLEVASIDELGIIADEYETLFEQWDLPASPPSPAWIGQLEQKLGWVEGEALAKRLPVIRPVRKRGWVAAASILVLISVGAIWYAMEARQQSGNAQKPIGVLSNFKSVSTLRGQRKQFILPDGSKIMLNVASSVAYSSFFEKDRSLELSGEAYFEVVRNDLLPFKVKIRDAEVEVLGTRFNIMTYPDEPVSQTTVIAGAVKVISPTGVVSLKGGDQAEIGYSLPGNSPPKLLRGVKEDAILAWQKDSLMFNNTEMHIVMRAIARVYNIDIQYEGNVPARYFSGTFAPNNNIRQISALLKSQGIHNRTKGRTIVVML